MLLCSLSNDISTDNIRVVSGLGVKDAAIAAVIWSITIPQTYNHRGFSAYFASAALLLCIIVLNEKSDSRRTKQ